MGAQISFLNTPPDHASAGLEDMPGYLEPPPTTEILEKVSILEGASDSTISGGTFNAAGRDVTTTMTTTTTVNNITINFVDTTPFEDTKILDWLSIINYRALQMVNFEKAIAGTCSWFLRSRIFKQFLEGQFNILWGTGMPGAGKTTLASIVIEHLQNYAKLRGPRIALAFAYCRYTEPVPVQQILAALIRQLLERYPFLYPLVQPIYEQHRREMTKPSKSQLLRLLSDISQVFETLFCALDGLDEAAPDIQFDLLKALSSVKAQFFITSRPLQPLHSVLPNARFFTIVAHDEDIELLIHDKLDQDPVFRTLSRASEYEKTRNQIVSEVKKAAGGMFLHATLQVEMLLHTTNLRHALDILKHSPTTINDVYAKTMERINAQPGARPQLARRILSWLAYARRGLNVDDVRYALAIPLSHPLPPNADIIDPMLLTDEAVLVSMCCGLVVVDNSRSRPIRLVHYTAVDFLKQIIEPAEAHTLLATTCIRRIISVADTISEFIEHQNDPFGVSVHYIESPLLDYALKSWAKHSRYCIGPDGATTDTLVREVAYLFLRCPSILNTNPEYSFDYMSPWTVLGAVTSCVPAALAPLIEAKDSQITQIISNQVNVPTSSPSSWLPLILAIGSAHIPAISTLLAIPNIDIDLLGPALTISARWGLVEVVKLLIADPRFQVNAIMDGVDGREVQTPLMVAADNGNEDIARVLLSCERTRPDVKLKDGTTALMIAAAAGSVGVVQLLLGRTDVDVHQVHPNGLTLLMLAASRGHIAVVDVLLAQRAIDADTKNARGETALMLAVREGHIEVTRRLLGRADVDVHQVQPDGLTLLMLAASRGYTTVVDVLLTRLAVDADAKNARGETALMLAVQEGHIEVTLRLLGLTDVVVHQDGLISDLLLRQPAIDVNATNNSGETALMLAARWGRTKIAHRLLQVPHMELLQKDLNGRSAFMLAVFHRQIDVLRMFLSLIQFAVNVAEKEGHSTLDLPERGDRGIAVDVELNQPGVDFNIEGMGDVDATLMVAARGSDLKRLRRLLAFPPYTVNLKFIDGASPTALNLAFRSSARPNSVVLIFIKRPGLVQSRNLRSSRPALGMPTADSAGHDLLAAAKCGDVEIVDRLFAEDSKLDPNLKDLDGWTALMWATWHARIGVVQRLLRHEKIDVGAFSHTGLDARDIAMRRGLSDILEVIERAVLTVSHSTHPPQNLDSSTTRDAEVAAFEVVFGSHHVPEGVIGQEYSEEGAEVDEIQLLNLNNMDLSS